MSVATLVDAMARLLPKDIDITFVATAAGIGAGVGSVIAGLAGRDPARAVLLGARWGGLCGLVYLVSSLVAGLH